MARAIAAGLLMALPGDSAWSIAGDFVGDSRRGPELVALNPGRPIVPGIVLVAPRSWVVRAPGPGAWADAMADAAGLVDVSEWDEDALAVLRGMALYWHLRPVEILGIFLQESGLDIHGVRGGYMGLVSGSPKLMDSGNGWPAGTWKEIVTARSLDVQLKAIATFWRNNETRYVRTSYLSRARAWGTSVAGLIYAGNFLPGKLMLARSADDPLVSDPDGFYKDNRGLDEDRNGSISVRDLAVRIAKKASEVAATYPGLASEAKAGAASSPWTGALSFGSSLVPGTIGAGVPGSSVATAAKVPDLAVAGLALAGVWYFGVRRT